MTLAAYGFNDFKRCAPKKKPAAEKFSEKTNEKRVKRWMNCVKCSHETSSFVWHFKKGEISLCGSSKDNLPAKLVTNAYQLHRDVFFFLWISALSVNFRYLTMMRGYRYRTPPLINANKQFTERNSAVFSVSTGFQRELHASNA